MKPLTTCLLLAALLLVLPLSLHAQLSAEQRVFDFENLAALYSKRYAPYDWKRAAFGFDLLNIKPWVDRIRTAKSDLEFFEIEAEYVGRLQDTHSGFQMSSTFRASLGMSVDIYDGKVLIDSINRTQLPAASYPFQVGDELVSVDGVSSEDWIKRLSTWRQYGNPVTTRRIAAQQITLHVQATFPRAAEIGETAIVEIRRSSGALERYTIRWAKSGVPFTVVGPTPMPQLSTALNQPQKDSTYLEGIDDLHHYELPANDFIRCYVNGIGSVTPIFRGGFPSNFVQRLGLTASDFHFSGTYTANGATIGFLRIPSFAPSNTAATVLELRNEIDYMQKNTDALVVDVTRNPGGGCYMIDVCCGADSVSVLFLRRTNPSHARSLELFSGAAGNRAADRGQCRRHRDISIVHLNRSSIR
jgi:PDZ domain/Peptidase family S41